MNASNRLFVPGNGRAHAGGKQPRRRLWRRYQPASYAFKEAFRAGRTRWR